MDGSQLISPDCLEQNQFVSSKLKTLCLYDDSDRRRSLEVQQRSYGPFTLDFAEKLSEIIEEEDAVSVVDLVSPDETKKKKKKKTSAVAKSQKVTIHIPEPTSDGYGLSDDLGEGLSDSVGVAHGQPGEPVALAPTTTHVPSKHRVLSQTEIGPLGIVPSPHTTYRELSSQPKQSSVAPAAPSTSSSDVTSLLLNKFGGVSNEDDDMDDE
jgi:hypothetical protein